MVCHSDLDISGNSGKAIELRAVSTVANLADFAVGVANNGGGTDGGEIDTLPQISLAAGDTFWLLRDPAAFARYFGANTVFGTGVDGIDFTVHDRVSLNGDDAVELFFFGQLVDVFGDVNLDGTGSAWEYKDSWAWRNPGSMPNGGSFSIDQWTLPTISQCSDESTSNCDSACGPYPDFAGECQPISGCGAAALENGGFEADHTGAWQYIGHARNNM